MLLSHNVVLYIYKHKSFRTYFVCNYKQNNLSTRMCVNTTISFDYVKISEMRNENINIEIQF